MVSPMRSRYSVLIGLLVATVALVGGTAAEAAITTPPCFACSGFVTGEPLQEPQRVESTNGSLSTSLTAKLTTTTVGGRTVRGEVYNGQFPGPTLVISPGDQFNVLLRNRMQADYLPYGASSLDPPPIFPGQPYAGFPQPLGNITNLHVHGLHVSPKAPSDDVLLAIKPGGQYQYRYSIPADHPTGLFWYHPHGHMYTDMQLSQGQAGAIIMRGGLDEIAGIKGLRDRLMVIQNVQVKNGAIASGQYQVPKYRLITINGQVQPVVDIKPGETQRWRILNATTERFMKVLPMGGATYWQLSMDGNTLSTPRRIGRIWLAPGQRMEVLVQAGAKTGSFPLIQSHFKARPTPYGLQPRVQIATLRVAGEAQTPEAIPTTLLPQRDLRGKSVKIAAKRVIRFTQSPPRFFIDGALFYDHRTPNATHDHGGTSSMPAMGGSGGSGNTVGPTFLARVGTVQEWTIANDSPEWHNFHMHVNNYQVVRRNGQALTGQPEWEDSIAIPPGRTVVVRIPFDDFVGTTVFHCHVLVHEDHGMMAVVKIRPAYGSTD